MSEKISTIDFYRRYDDLAVERESLDSVRDSIPDKEERIRQLELNQKTTELFSDFVGTQIDIEA